MMCVFAREYGCERARTSKNHGGGDAGLSEGKLACGYPWGRADVDSIRRRHTIPIKGANLGVSSDSAMLTVEEADRAGCDGKVAVGVAGRTG